MTDEAKHIYSLGRSHFMHGYGHECLPSSFMIRDGVENESPSTLLHSVSQIITNTTKDKEAPHHAFLCESLYYDEALTVLKRYEQHAEEWLESHASSLFIINASAASLFAIGYTSGVIADLGKTHSTVLACENGNLIHGSVQNAHSSEKIEGDPVNAISSDIQSLPDGSPLCNKPVHQPIDFHRALFDPQALREASITSYKCMKPLKYVPMANRITHELLTGGNALFPGLSQWLQFQLTRYDCPLSVLDVKKIRPRKDVPSNPQILPFQGTAILSEYLTESSSISRREYAESGGRIVAQKLMCNL